MGLATRVIQSLLIRGDQAVHSERFNAWRSVGHPEQAMRVMNARSVDEVLVLDIGATLDGRGPNFKLIERLTECCFSPITVGGGVRSVEDVRDLLKSGADKVSIRTRTDVIFAAANKFGRQAIVVSMDVRADENPSMIAAHAKINAALGAGEILLTSIERDGTMRGYDLELIREVSATVDVPVVANGGAGRYEHMAEAIKAGASAVCAGTMFRFTDATPKGAARYLAAHGIEARVP